LQVFWHSFPQGGHFCRFVFFKPIQSNHVLEVETKTMSLNLRLAQWHIEYNLMSERTSCGCISLSHQTLEIWKPLSRSAMWTDARIMCCLLNGWNFIHCKYVSLLQIAQACKPIVVRIGFWESVKSLARGYEFTMGLLLFTPIAVLSWFPFVSEFQTRLLFNQAFSRGLQISRILAGRKKL
jgi:hypothetical protein